jgi:WD40 repeat protein
LILVVASCVLLAGGAAIGGYFLFSRDQSSAQNTTNSSPDSTQFAQQKTTDTTGKEPTPATRPNQEPKTEPKKEEPKTEPKKEEPRKEEPKAEPESRPETPQVPPLPAPLYALRETPQPPVDLKLTDPATQLVFLPDGKRAIIAVNHFDRAQRYLSIVEVPSGQEIRKIPTLDFPVQAMALAPDGQTVVVGGRDDRFNIDPPLRQYVHLVSLQSGKIVRAVPGPKQTVRALALSRDGTLLATGEENPMPAVRVVHLDTGKVQFVKEKAHQNIVYAVHLTPDNKYVVSAGVDDGGAHPGKVIVWDLAAGTQRHVFKDYPGTAEGIAVSADGKLVAAAINDPATGGSLRVWDIETGEEKLALIGKGLNRGASRICFGPEDKTVLAIFYNGTIRVFEIKTGNEVGGFSGHTLAPNALSMAPDGKMVASIYFREVKLWAFPDSLKRLSRPDQPPFVQTVLNGKEIPAPATLVQDPTAKTLTEATVEATQAKTILHLAAAGQAAKVFLQKESKFFDKDGKEVPAAEAARICRIGNIVTVKTRKPFGDDFVVEIRLVKEGPTELALAKVNFTEIGPRSATIRAEGKDRGIAFARTLRLVTVDGQEAPNASRGRFIQLNRPYSVKLSFEVGAEQPVLTEVRELPKEATPVVKSNPLDRPGARAVKNATVLVLTEKGTKGPGLSVEGQPPFMFSTAQDAQAYDKEGKAIPLNEALRPGTVADAIVQAVGKSHQLLEIRVITAASPPPEPAPKSRPTKEYKNAEVFKLKGGQQLFLKMEPRNIQVMTDAKSKAFDKDGQPVPVEQVLQNGNRVNIVLELIIPTKGVVVEVRAAEP